MGMVRQKECSLYISLWSCCNMELGFCTLQEQSLSWYFSRHWRLAAWCWTTHPQIQLYNGILGITSTGSVQHLTSSSIWFHRSNRLRKLHRISTGWLAFWATWSEESAKLSQANEHLQSNEKMVWSAQYKAWVKYC